MIYNGYFFNSDFLRMYICLLNRKKIKTFISINCYGFQLRKKAKFSKNI